MRALPWPLALERYSQNHPQEVLRVEVESEGESDLVLIYRGYSSSLRRPTPPDPEAAVIPPQARFLQLERLAAPYHPDRSRVLAVYRNWGELTAWLAQEGIPVTE
ncbi:hypothetical protein NW820_01435 [Synechococcus sp. R55.7]|uniref:DUF7734 family protein n=1 Tax=Synechococcus sp. R55.7 TaxID=2964500 RepID=UPI0039C21287